MDRNPVLLYKTLVIGVIVLFIGIGIQPAFAVTPDTIDNDDCNLCPKVSKSYIVRIQNLIDILEKYDSQLSVFSKLTPEIEEKYQEISDKIAILKEINEKYLINDGWSFPFIRLALCFILHPFLMASFILSILLTVFVGAFYELGYIWAYHIVRIILWIPLHILNYSWGRIFDIMDDLGCFPPDPTE